MMEPGGGWVKRRGGRSPIVGGVGGDFNRGTNVGSLFWMTQVLLVAANSVFCSISYSSTTFIGGKSATDVVVTGKER
jgi:hypothetical protein